MDEININSLCPVSGKCSGCQLKNLPYSQQLKLKQSRVNKLFYGIVKPEKIVPSPEIFRYRNKSSAVFYEDKNKNIRWGIYQSKTGGFCSTQKCFLQPEIADDIFNTLAQLIKSFKIKLYNDKDNSGFLRSAMVRTTCDNHVMVVLVTTFAEFPKERSFVNALVKKHSEIVCVVQNYYSGEAVLMTGEDEKILYGSGKITGEISGRKFSISANSFYQINSVQTVNLYSKAIEFAQIKASDTFLDAYCGTGTIGIMAAENGGMGTGVEINNSAVKDAVKNAELNSVDNIKFICADAGDELEKDINKYDAVFIDPPRAGCSKRFLKSVAKSKPQRIVYISCNPETQVRDVRFLIKNGYQVKTLVPFDMFPQTNHVESVVLLSKVHK